MLNDYVLLCLYHIPVDIGAIEVNYYYYYYLDTVYVNSSSVQTPPSGPIISNIPILWDIRFQHLQVR